MSIMKKMLLNIALLVLIISVVLGTTSYFVSSKALTAEYEAALLAKATDNAKVLEERMASKMKELETLSRQRDILSMDWAAQKPLLEQEAGRLNYEGIAVVDLKGQARYTDESKLDLSDRSYIRQALQGHAVMSDIIISRKTNLPALMLTVPITQDEKLLGLLLARIDGYYLSEIVSDIKFGSTGSTYIMNGQGTILGHPDPIVVLAETNYISLAEEDASFTALAKAARTMLETKQGSDRFALPGGDQLIGYAPIGGTDWFIVTGADAREVTGSLSELQSTILIWSVGALLCGIALAYIQGVYLSKPIKAVQQYGNQLAQGVFSQAVDDRLLKRKDEIGLLAHSFESMRASLQLMINEIRQAANEVVTSSEGLSSSSEQVAEATGHITNTMEAVASRTITTANASKETTRAMEETNAGLHRISASSTHIFDAAMASSQAAAQGNATLQQAIGQMDHIKDAVTESAMFVNSLVEQTKTIEEFVTIIVQIASETNLLALNASIEAARAGDEGRGFSVIAQNVHKLAEQSQCSAVQVEDIVRKISQETAKVLLAMQKGQQEAESGVAIMNGAELAFHAIRSGMDAMTEQLSEISAASEQLSASSDEVTAQMEEMTKLSQLTAASSHEVSTAAEEQMASVQEIASSSSKLKQLAHHMNELIDRFKC